MKVLDSTHKCNFEARRAIIARKIARAAWSIFKHKTTFDPKRLTCQP